MTVSNKPGRRLSWRMKSLLVLSVLLVTPLSPARGGENRESVPKPAGKATSNEKDEQAAKASSSEHRADVNAKAKKRESWLFALSFEGGKRIANPVELSETRARSLTLHGPHITDDALKRLTNHAGLQQLGLFDTCVIGPGLQHLANLDSLEKLVLAGPHVKGNGTVNLKHTQRLQQLQFVGDNVTDEWMRRIPPLKELYWLELHSTSVTPVGLQPIGEWTKLEKLYLNRNRSLDDQAVVYLKGFDRLRVLELRETQVTARGAG